MAFFKYWKLVLKSWIAHQNLYKTGPGDTFLSIFISSYLIVSYPNYLAKVKVIQYLVLPLPRTHPRNQSEVLDWYGSSISSRKHRHSQNNVILTLWQHFRISFQRLKHKNVQNFNSQTSSDQFLYDRETQTGCKEFASFHKKKWDEKGGGKDSKFKYLAL